MRGFTQTENVGYGPVERFHLDTACGLWAGGWGCCLAASRPPPQPPLPLYQWSARSSPLPPEVPLGGHVLLVQPSPGTCGCWRGRGAGPLGCPVYSRRLLGPMWVMGTAVPPPGRPTPGPLSSCELLERSHPHSQWGHSPAVRPEGWLETRDGPRQLGISEGLRKESPPGPCQSEAMV